MRKHHNIIKHMLHHETGCSECASNTTLLIICYIMKMDEVNALLIICYIMKLDEMNAQAPQHYLENHK